MFRDSVMTLRLGLRLGQIPLSPELRRIYPHVSLSPPPPSYLCLYPNTTTHCCLEVIFYFCLNGYSIFAATTVVINACGGHNNIFHIFVSFSAISYTVRATTGEQSDAGTEAKVYVVLIGTQAASEKIDLELVQKAGFEPGTAETFSVEAVDVGEVKKIEIGKLAVMTIISLQLVTVCSQ